MAEKHHHCVLQRICIQCGGNSEDYVPNQICLELADLCIKHIPSFKCRLCITHHFNSCSLNV